MSHHYERIVLAFIFAALLFQSAACTPPAADKDVAAAHGAPVSGSPMYLTGQVEWIARAFSPECRIKKTDVVMTGG